MKEVLRHPLGIDGLNEAANAGVDLGVGPDAFPVRWLARRVLLVGRTDNEEARGENQQQGRRSNDHGSHGTLLRSVM